MRRGGCRCQGQLPSQYGLEPRGHAWINGEAELGPLRFPDLTGARSSSVSEAAGPWVDKCRDAGLGCPGLPV